MKNKFIKSIVAISLLLGLCVTDVYGVYGEPARETAGTQEVSETSAETEDEKPEADVTIGSVEEFLEFAQECSYDAYSIGKVFALTADIDLLGADFAGIPYFNGTLVGNGHTISNVRITEKGSQQGLFRYLGESAKVSDLSVQGTIMPEGSQEEIGGIVGVNYGVITDCNFIGNVHGQEAVGGVAGRNASTGHIVRCTVEGVVMATNRTGGITGENEGAISDCTNESRINTEELEPVLDVAGMDISDLNITQSVVTRNNMGGIAGISKGIIKNCHNTGEIGYVHTGYNVGGIAGSQSGVVIDSVNDGDVYGRKDIGGIVGQAEPYVDSEYFSDQVNQLESDVNRLSRTATNMVNSLEETAGVTETEVDREALQNQYNQSVENMANRVDQMEDAVGDNEEAQENMNQIQQAMENIQNIQGNGDSLTDDQLEAIRNNMQIIEDNSNQLESIVGTEVTSAVDGITVPEVSGQSVSDKLSEGATILNDGITSISNQVNSMANRAANAVNRDYISDISSIKTAAMMDGVISGSVNRGIVEGDLNVGGIAGTMNIEYEDDPEMDFDASAELNIVTNSEINDVIISCINYGKVTVKKNCAGSVVGLQTVGYIYDSEAYGHVKTTSGSYVGGVAGWSRATVEKCYAMLDLTGEDYVGGITGLGAAIKDCLSIPRIEASGERVGAVSGHTEGEGSLEGNYFIKDDLDAIDRISYMGIAEPMSYEEMMQLEDIPEGFSQVQIAFEVEDEVIEETLLAYGASLTEGDFPAIEEREGYYISWPDESEYTNITNNLNIVAEYVPWVQSIASEEIASDGKPILIVAGEFYDGTELVLKETDCEVEVTEDENLLYAYDWEISAGREKAIDSLEGHFYLQNVENDVELWIKQEGDWILVDATVDGRYMVAEIPYGVAFAVVEAPSATVSIYVIAVAAVLLILLVISVVILHNKRRKKKQNNENDKE